MWSPKRRKLRRDTIAHYRRMQKEVKILIKLKSKKISTKNLASFLETHIGENYYAEYCLYCKQYLNILHKSCPLNLKDDYCKGENCCNGLWNDLEDSITLQEWLDNSEKIVTFIKKYG
jgi:hypothetical protein